MYESPQVNYYYADGVTPITGGLENNIVLLFVKDHNPEATDYVIGGLTIQPGQTQMDNGWFWSSDGVGYLGLKPGETAVNGLNGGSYWIGGVDLNGDGDVGEFNGNLISFDDDEAMVYGEEAFPGAYYFTMEGVPQHPEEGTGPMTIQSIDIIAPFTLPEPATTISFSNGMLSVSDMRSGRTNWLESCTALYGPWTTLLVWTATGSATNIPFSPTNMTEFIRAGFFR